MFKIGNYRLVCIKVVHSHDPVNIKEMIMSERNLRTCTHRSKENYKFSSLGVNGVTVEKIVALT